MQLDPGRIYSMPRNLVLAASAGTGKTHTLVGVILHLLVTDRQTVVGGSAPIEPGRIVATTFSRKAAAEIRARVAVELEKLVGAPETSAYASSLRNALGDEVVRGFSGSAAERQGRVDREISARARRAFARVGQARFGTLHSFATGIVRSYAIELGLGPGFDLASEADLRARAEEAIARALEARLSSDPDVVRALVDAAGGVDRLVDQLRRALGQLEEDGRSAADLVVADDAEAIARDVHSTLEHARALTAVPRFELQAHGVLDAWTSGEPSRLESALVAFCGVPATGKKTPDVEAFALFRKELPGTTNDDKGRRLARAYAVRKSFVEHARVVRAILAEAEATITSEGRARAALGFGELLRAARELLRDRPDVAEEVSGGIDALLVDEFQDTSRVQRDLLVLLWARKGTRAAGAIPPLSVVRKTGLLVVGDRKQSIYGFRGADVGVFAELAVGLAGAPAREALGIPAGVTWEPREPIADFFALRHNRRSEPAILTFANAFSARRFCPGDPPPELHEIVYVATTEDLLVPPERAAEHTAEPLEDGRGGALVAPAPAPRTTWLRVAPKKSSSTRIEEALVIGERVRAIVQDGAPRVGRSQRPPSFRDIAVLATTNGMLDAVAFALAQAEVPYVVAGKSFFRTREVRDLAAMLALVLDPTDRLAMLEVLRGPWVSAHDETLLGLTRPGEGLVTPANWRTPPDASLIRSDDRPALERAADLIDALGRCAGRLGPGAILRQAVEACELEQVLGVLPRGEQRVANVRKLLLIADRHGDAASFRTWLDEASEQEIAESEAATFSEEDDAVRLLTVHASKGLDFPIVFVPELGAALPRSEKGALRLALGSGNTPNLVAARVAEPGGMILEPPAFTRAYAAARRRERAERQRLAYVAMTRAADAMYLVGGRSKEGGGEPGTSSLAVLEELALGANVAAATALAIEPVAVPPPPAPRQASSALTESVGAGRSDLATSLRPRWRSLPIAPTALRDFAHCPRRFELVHVLGLPEYARVARSETARASETRAPLDARAQGTLAHAVLERIPVAAFAGEEAENAASRALAAEGVPSDHPQHAAITARVVGFLRGQYAQTSASAGAELRREVAFVLAVPDAEGRAVVLRGSIDLLVIWPDGSVDVVDYKSARGGDVTAYAFQLEVYTLAARELFPQAPRLRAGLVFLGARSAEPVWHRVPDELDVRTRLAGLGDRLVTARWTRVYERVELARCEAIYCGFIGRCHSTSVSSAGEQLLQDASDGLGTG